MHLSEVRPRIRLADPAITADEQDAVREALASGRLAQGPRVAEFEQAFAAYVGVRHAVAVNSGTAALHVALLVHGIGAVANGEAGDEVIVPAFSFAATANAVLQAGARPVFVDVREGDFNINPAAIEAAASPKTRAVIGVHLFGDMCDVKSIGAVCEARGLVLIEDAAQAVGAALDSRAAGSFGTGCFSFYATKNVTTGEGGMVTTDQDAIAERARMLRSQGERERYLTEELGWNYRMTEVEAALGIVRLRSLDDGNRQRQTHAQRLSALLDDLPQIATPQESSGKRHAWHQYVIRVLAGREERDALQRWMGAAGVETAVFYPRPIHQQPLYRRLGYGESDAPVAERLSSEVLALPVHPTLGDEDLQEISDAVHAFFARRGGS